MWRKMIVGQGFPVGQQADTQAAAEPGNFVQQALCIGGTRCDHRKQAARILPGNIRDGQRVVDTSRGALLEDLHASLRRLHTDHIDLWQIHRFDRQPPIEATMEALHDVVKVDYFLPGCPPPADAIWQFLTDLIAGRTPSLGHGLIHYD